MRDDGPFEANPHYVRLSPSGHSDKYTGLQNEGFFGVTVHKDSTYLFSAWLRAPEGPAKIRVELADPSSMGETQVYAKADIDVTSKDWQRYTATLKANNSVNKGIPTRTLSMPSTSRSSPSTLGTACAPTSFRRSKTSNPAYSASPAAA